MTLTTIVKTLIGDTDDLDKLEQLCCVTDALLFEIEEIAEKEGPLRERAREFMENIRIATLS